MEDINFIISTLELFISKGKDVKKEYLSQVKKQAVKAKIKSKKRVEIIDHGLSIHSCKELFILQGSFLNDYIDSGKYDTEYATSIAKSLKGKSPLSEVLQAKIMIDEAKKTEDTLVKELKLRSALEFKNTHDNLFDISAYQNILPLIESQLLETATLYFDTHRQKSI